MFRSVTLSVQQVWDDVLWRAVTVYTEDDAGGSVVLEKSGRVALGPDRGPDELLAAALRDMQARAYGEAPPTGD